MMKMIIYYHQDSMVWMTWEFDWQYPLGTCVSAEQVDLGWNSSPTGPFLQFCLTKEDKPNR